MKNKRGNVSVIALIIVIIAITASVITWIIATKTQAPVQQAIITQPAPTPAVQQPAQPTQPASATQEIMYSNGQYGFQLTFPASWKGYEAENVAVNGELDVSFNVGEQSGFNIFSLNGVSLKEKSDIAMSDQGCIIGQTDKIVVFSTDCCNGVEATAKTDPFDDFQKARCAEVPAILKTFKTTE